MPRKKQFGVAVSFATIVLLIIAYAFATREPRYQGKTASQWVAQYYEMAGPKAGSFVELHQYSAADVKLCEDALRHFGPDLLPVLIRMAATRDASWRFKLLELSNKTGFIGSALRLVRPLFDTNPFYSRQAARQSFAFLGADGHAAIPQLIKLLHDRDPAVAENAAMILGEMGPVARAATPDLVALAQNTNANARNGAIWGLGGIKATAPEAVPVVLRALNDQETSFYALQTLGSIRVDPDIAVPIFVDTLRKPQRDLLRYEVAIRSLANFGSAANSTIPLIRPFLTNEDDVIREAATNTLQTLDHLHP